MKELFAASVIILFSVAASSAEGENEAMRNWSIPEKKMARKTRPAADEPQCGGHLKRQKAYPIYLTRSDDSPNVVAVVEIRPDKSNENELKRTAVFNPDGYDYGPIPSLAAITEKQADKVWGKPKVEKGARTYSFHSKNGRHEYFVEICFNENQITKYRVTSTDFTRAQTDQFSNWQNVPEKEVGEP